eukprot:TRINITY_DN1015_c1_g1_i1.p1 TRINITY_DN1015_c1_g1~~TRINITY_DN1015_c1_g1_i1.p1  ORF type:complete len:183 (-),score=42.83 TRINITY_DN1015_c1_g1_i1:65-550(-)
MASNNNGSATDNGSVTQGDSNAPVTTTTPAARIETQEQPTTPLPSISSSNLTEEQLAKMTRQMFQNVSAYLRAELSATTEEYKLLDDMNKVAISKYQDMSSLAAGLVVFTQTLQAKYGEFQPYLDKLELVEKGLTDLEQTVALLDDYTRKLEAKFKALNVL